MTVPCTLWTYIVHVANVQYYDEQFDLDILIFCTCACACTTPVYALFNPVIIFYVMRPIHIADKNLFFFKTPFCKLVEKNKRSLKNVGVCSVQVIMFLFLWVVHIRHSSLLCMWSLGSEDSHVSKHCNNSCNVLRRSIYTAKHRQTSRLVLTKKHNPEVGWW